jgi:hypothetical protein
MVRSLCSIMILLFTIGSLGVSGCGKKDKDDDDDDATPAAPTDIVAATQSVGALAISIGMEYGSTSLRATKGSNFLANEMSGTAFDAPAFPARENYTDTGTVSPSIWAGQVMNPEGRNPDSDYGYFKTFFGRLMSNLDTICVAAYLMDGIVVEGTYERSLNEDNVEDINKKCGTSYNAEMIAEGYPEGKPFSMTVTSVADESGSNFNEKLLVQSGEEGTEDYREETIFVRANETLVRLMMTEKGNNYDDEIIRSLIDYDIVDGDLKFEYVESYAADGSTQRINEIYRAFIKDSGPFSALARFYTENSSAITLGLTGDLEDEVAASFTAVNTTATFDNAQLCINQQTGDFIAAGECPDSGFSVDLADVADVYKIVNETDMDDWVFDETVEIPDFEGDEVFTSPITNP